MSKFKGLLGLLLMLCTQIVMAQTKTITGTVTDDNGMPLPSVSILIQGTTTGVTTDFDGNYSIDNVNSNDKLIFSYVGMQEKVVEVNEQTTIVSYP